MPAVPWRAAALVLVAAAAVVLGPAPADTVSAPSSAAPEPAATVTGPGSVLAATAPASAHPTSPPVSTMGSRSVSSAGLWPVPAQPPPTPPPSEPDPAPEVDPWSTALACGTFDVTACINEAFTGLLRAASSDLVTAASELLSETLLATPRPTAIPRLVELWSMSWRIAVALYTTVVLVGALVVMAHQSVQTRYSVREIAPRLVFGFFAGWLSLPLVDMAVEIANAVSGALASGVSAEGGATAAAGIAGLAQLVRSTLAAPLPGGSAWPLLLVTTAIAVLLLAVVCGYVLRVLGLAVLVAAAPLVVMWHALPQTDPVARWWWRAVAGLLSIQIIQALIIAVGLALLVSNNPADTDGATGPATGAGGGVLGLATGGSRWLDLLVLGVLLWLLLRVPGWVWSSVKLRAGGSSLIATALKVAVAFRTAGMIGGLAGAVSAGRGASRRAPGAGRRGGPGAGSGGTDPYAAAPVFAGGQLGIPFTGLPTRHRARTAAGSPARSTARPGGSAARPAADTDRAPGPGQTALPLAEGLWPEHRPVTGRDGQLRLPLDVTRTPRPPGPPGRPDPFGGPDHPPQRASRRDRDQLRLPADGVWPEHRAVAGPDGQLRLPIPVTRSRPARAPGPAPRPTVATFGGRQIPLDLRPPDPYRGNRARRSGQYPLPLPGLHRAPVPRTAPDPVPGAVPGPLPADPPTGTQLRLPIPAVAPNPPRPASPAHPPRSGRPGRPVSRPPDPPPAPSRPAPRTTPPPPPTPPPAPPPPPPPPSPSASPSPPPSGRSAGRRPRRAPQLPMRKDRP